MGALKEQLLKFDDAARSPDFSHSRERSWRLSGHVYDDSDIVVYVYRREKTSPSGVILAASLNDVKVAREILRDANRPVSAAVRMSAYGML